MKLRRERKRQRQKVNRFNEQNNNFARASPCLAHFFAVPVQLRREMKGQAIIPSLSPLLSSNLNFIVLSNWATWDNREMV